ncbi:enoyl-CoA hydratase-related protein [Litoreibacter roseus]|uniref:3-hydroxyacyl-CoA dehydrogenase n=1 Tax=Litoreibacter roseus TaxID=2601869 RepID=A0A6N6JBX9_9RHOB|nr:enoyl-CoA hydratase-related protein [Litoreibacter roseus]GFE63656.1 3-hydroxyacyl-CoA dehydrogenase [Litoreibacter roseus]
MTDKVTQTRIGAQAVLRIDNPPVNTLTAEVRRELLDAFDEAVAAADVTAIVIAASGQTFPVGRDIYDLDRPASPPDLRLLCERIEASPKPVVVALHGTVLGGGLELAVAAHHRIARVGTQLGCPEISLGLPPCAGGTQRIPRLIGADGALDLMLSGRMIDAAQALKLGLVDEVTDLDLEQAAIDYASVCGVRRTSDQRIRMEDGAHFLQSVEAHRAKSGSFVAVKIVDCVEAALLLPMEAGLTLEAEAFAECAASDVAVALRHIFFAEEAAAQVVAKDVQPVRHLGLVGGADVAILALNSGLTVTLVSPDRAEVEDALDHVGAHFEVAVASGMPEVQAVNALSRLSCMTEFAALAECDLVLDQSGDTPDPWWELDGDLPDVLARENIFSMRLQFPARGAKLAEITTHSDTQPETVAKVMQTGRQMGRVPLCVDMTEGGLIETLVSRMEVLMGHLAPVASSDILSAALSDVGLPAAAFTVPTAPLEDERLPVAAVRERLECWLINEAAYLISAGAVTQPTDVDVALVHGLGYARTRGGPILQADRITPFEVVQRIKRFALEDGSHWHAADLLQRLANERQKFRDLKKT